MGDALLVTSLPHSSPAAAMKVCFCEADVEETTVHFPSQPVGGGNLQKFQQFADAIVELLTGDGAAPASGASQCEGRS